jgi:hypothetical protein
MEEKSSRLRLVRPLESTLYRFRKNIRDQLGSVINSYAVKSSIGFPLCCNAPLSSPQREPCGHWRMQTGPWSDISES